MEFFRSLRILWRHPLFRKLVAVRVVTQASDGTLQIGMAAYVLFSPQAQPDAWAIFGILALTLLPFSLLGPFVSVVLDRWPRQRVIVGTDLGRGVICLALALLVVGGEGHTGWRYTMFFVAVLLAMSMNRFLLAGLSAGLPHTIDPDEYLSANAVMPTIGPLGVVMGAGVALAVRVIGQMYVPSYVADAAIFTIAAVGFASSVLLAMRIKKHQLGPDVEQQRTVGQIASGLADAFRLLKATPIAATGLIGIGAQRLAYGVVMVAVILGYRNYFYTPSQIDLAVAGMGLWAAITGVGFLLSALVTPLLAGRASLRQAMTGLLLLCAVVQVFPGSVFVQPALLVAGFLLGLGSQSFKICVDTLVQAHIDNDYKGRVFVIYDMVFNAALVLAALICALVLPPVGLSLPVFIAVGVAFALIAAAFWWLTRGIDPAEFAKGTEALLGGREKPAG